MLFLLFSCTNSTNQSGEKETTQSEEKVTEITVQEIEYSADTLDMTGYLAHPASPEAKLPGILIVHEWWGHTDYVRKRAEMLAELGYVAFALDMYGEGRKANHPGDAQKFSKMVMSNIGSAKDRFEAALDVLQASEHVDSTQIAAIGYCFGGSVVLSMANAGYPMDAVAAFHSGVELPIPPSSKIKAKVLVANGAADPLITEEQIKNFKSAMDSVNADYEYISYPNALHAYTNPIADSLGMKFELPLAYNATADSLAWQELQSLLKTTFKN